MRKRSTLKLRNQIKLKTALRRRLLAGAAGMFIVVASGTMAYLNFSADKSFAGDLDDGQTTEELKLSGVCSANPEMQRKWKVVNPNNFDIAIQWDIYPELQSGLFIAKPGENFIFTNTIPGSNVLRIRWQDQEGEWFDNLQPASTEACASSGCYASEVVSYIPAKRNDGSLIPGEFQISSKALGAPQNDETSNYVSLGFGGEITLKFADPVANGPGEDILVSETTFGRNPCSRYPEKVQAFASQDGCHFIYLGEGCQDARFDLGAMTWARYIKLKDVSSVSHPYGGQVADGYDIDAVECLNGPAAATPNDGLVAGSAQDVVHYVQGSRKNGTAIHPSRTNAEMALGVPQNDDLGINFVSLGFTGMIVLKFDYVIFNREGNDLQIIETSYGISECQLYPEQAFFEGSLDGERWFPMGEVCLDGELDLGSGVYAIQFVRVTDRSPASSFPNSADGFDFDGIIVLADCPGEERIKPYDNTTVPDEIAEIKISPNPFRDICSLEYETGSVDERIQVTIFNYVGQQVHHERVKIPKNTLYQHQINGSQLPKGVYIVSIESAGQKQSLRIIKN
jgi:hypothetical protein